MVYWLLYVCKCVMESRSVLLHVEGRMEFWKELHGGPKKFDAAHTDKIAAKSGEGFGASKDGSSAECNPCLPFSIFISLIKSSSALHTHQRSPPPQAHGIVKERIKPPGKAMVESTGKKSDRLREQIVVAEAELQALKAQLAHVEADEEEAASRPQENGHAAWKWPLEAGEYERYGRQLILPSVGINGTVPLPYLST